ncbi:hypothetical protein C7M84_019608 [Penaeus vannamei]|uniref:Uncharacterized protein n=1 Tax=Penaeus vannamei TaxID=6689 RepID=A0A3R7SIK8_PENVA|nr:hypothetical protein C7M84_019608 [Penaeus vannamei]
MKNIVQVKPIQEDVRQPEKEENIRSIFYSYCENVTTLHGYGHIVRNKNNFLRILWSVVVFGLLVVLACFTFEAFDDFVQRKVLTQTQQKLVTTGGVGLPLPNVMICNRSFFSRAKLNDMGINAEMSSYLMVLVAGPGIAAKSLFTSAEGEQTLQGLQHSLDEILQERNMTLRELIDAISYTCEDLVSRCGMLSSMTEGAECCRRFTSTPTYLGKCLLRPSYVGEKQAYGNQEGHLIYLKVPTDDTPDFSPKILTLSKTAKTGIQVTVAGNLTYQGILVFSQGAIIPPGTQTTMMLSLTKVNNHNLRTWADVFEEPCVPPESITDFESLLKISSNCFDGAVYSCFKEMCGCTTLQDVNATERLCTPQATAECLDALFFQIGKMAHTDAFVGIRSSPSPEVLRQLQRCWEREKARCVTACEEFYFSYVSNTVPIRPEVAEALGEEFGMDNMTQVAVVTASFPKMEYTEIWSTRKGLDKLFAEQGCISAFFTGASLFTMMEASFFTIVMYCKLFSCIFRCKRKEV